MALGRVDERLDLPAHRRPRADRPAQHRLVDDGPQLDRLRPVEDLLAAHPQVDAAVDLLCLGPAVAEQHHRPRVVRRLQQPRHELHLVRADQRGGGLQPEIGLEPVGQHVAVAVPPSGRVGLPGQGEQPLPLVGVDLAVEREQILDVALLEAHPPELHPADLGLGRPDLPAGVLPADPLRLAEPAQVRAEQHAQDRRATPGSGCLASGRHAAPPCCRIPAASCYDHR